jgi:hypothetical protein
MLPFFKEKRSGADRVGHPAGILEESELAHKDCIAHSPGRDILIKMNAALGYALLRDRRVSLRPKLVALGVGLAAVGFIELLEIPLESVLALLLPAVGAAGDIAVDGVEAVVVPVLVATLLMPYLAPPSIVQQLRAERAARA